MASGRFKPREQGDLGELSAIEWLTSRGATIAIPVFHSPDWDLIAELDSRPLRVQVKTCTYSPTRGRWAVQLCTRGGNQSWNGVVKYLDASRCDYVFILVGDGRRWFIPTESLDCRSRLTLGGSKYSQFEIEQGRPLKEPPVLQSSARGSSGAVKRGAL
jgi:hypothetical protein